ncbi:hypothetical protein Bca101_098050 [Brassica carinata]
MDTLREIEQNTSCLSSSSPTTYRRLKKFKWFKFGPVTIQPIFSPSLCQPQHSRSWFIR